MDDVQQEPQTQTNQPIQTIPLVEKTVIGNPMPPAKKRLILRLSLLGAALLIATGTAYVLLVFIPNLPENIFKQAMASFAAGGNNFTITGRLDQSDVEEPDYDFAASTNSEGNTSFGITTTTLLLKPHLMFINADGKYYVKFADFEDSATLAKHYSNGQPNDLQQKIAKLVDAAGIYPKQDKWFEIGSYVFSSPSTATTTATTGTNQADPWSGVVVSHMGEQEDFGGKPVRKYELQLTKDAFVQLISRLDKSSVLASQLSSGVVGDEFKVNVWVNTSTKTVYSMSYEGEPLADSTLTLNLVANDGIAIDAPKATKLTSEIDFGFANSVFFNPMFQPLSDEDDRERVADLKGIKTALEIYKAKNGHYPSRQDIGVQQSGFVASKMTGTDVTLFKDPKGVFIGQAGSEYSYVPTTSDDNEECYSKDGSCKKFFIVTTLKSGSQYQLNSD